MFQTNFIPQGWECPKCKRIYSPTTVMCSYCPQNTTSVTTSGTTATLISGSTWSAHNFEKIKGTCKCKICGLEKWQHPQISNT
jgi:rubredoxin